MYNSISSIDWFLFCSLRLLLHIELSAFSAVDALLLGAFSVDAIKTYEADTNVLHTEQFYQTGDNK